MVESLFVGRNFVSGICKLKTYKKTKNLKKLQTWAFTSPVLYM